MTRKFLPLLVAGLLLGSCSGHMVCHDKGTRFQVEGEYSETDYNPVLLFTSHFYPGVYDAWHRPSLEMHAPVIYREDATVTSQAVKVYGYVCDNYNYDTRDTEYYLWRTDTCWADPQHTHFLPVSNGSPDFSRLESVAISYDAADTAVRRRLASAGEGDTVYLSGRLRLWNTYDVQDLNYNCQQTYPGIWVDNAEDITFCGGLEKKLYLCKNFQGRK